MESGFVMPKMSAKFQLDQRCAIIEQCVCKTINYEGSGIKRRSCWKCSSCYHAIRLRNSYNSRTF